MGDDILKNNDDLKYPTQYMLLGQSYLIKGKFDKAIKAYQKALRMTPDKPKAQFFLGDAWFKKAVSCRGKEGTKRAKCIHKAVKHYSKAEDLSPDSVVGELARRQRKEANKQKIPGTGM